MSLKAALGAKLTWYEKLAINFVKCGDVPRHVAFILDGNRRFEKANNLKEGQGHHRGLFLNMSMCIKWCNELGIDEITAYMFSIANFNRTSQELKILMEIMESFALQFVDNEEVVKRGICVRVLGRIDLFPQRLQTALRQAINCTKNNTKFIINMAVAYTSREEITHAIKVIVENASSSDREKIDEQFFSNHLYTRHSRNPDILIRTSGVTRFSDFLLWQIATSQIYVVNKYWPEFNLWELLKIIFRHQCQRFTTQSGEIIVNDVDNEYD